MKKKTKSDVTKVLEILATSNKPVTAKQLARRANMEYASVRKRVHDLRNRGYDITTISVEGVNGSTCTRYQL